MVKIGKFISIVLIVASALTLSTVFRLTQPTLAAVGVLFDTGHQINASDIWGYLNMTTDLTSRGFSFNEDDNAAITEEDLYGNHILVIVRPDNRLSPWEISNIHSFIDAGHGLLVMSDGLTATATSSINTLLSPYGLEQSSKRIRTGINTNITDHDITKGVSKYYQPTGGCHFIVSGSSAESLIRDEAGRTLVATSRVRGRIVVVSDEYAFRGDSYNRYDNGILMRNIFDWLSNIEHPTADFSAQPRTGEIPLNIQFTDKSTGDISKWHWDFGDGETSDQRSPKHIYDHTGRYTVSLEVTGTTGKDSNEKKDYIHVTEAFGVVAETEPSGLTTSSIKIEPTQVLSNEGAKISINVTNRGDTRQSYQAILTINGELEESQFMDVNPGSSQTVVFDVTKTKPGTYQVSINGHKVQFVVTESTPSEVIVNQPSGVTTSSGLETPTIIAIVLGSVGTAVALFSIIKRRRRPDTLQDIAEKYRKLLDELRK